MWYKIITTWNRTYRKAELKGFCKQVSELLHRGIKDFPPLDPELGKRLEYKYLGDIDHTKNKRHHGTKMRLIYKNARQIKKK